MDMDTLTTLNVLFMAILILLTLNNGSNTHTNEPNCSSRFDFEEKLLERTITGELKMKQMEEFLSNMEAAWKLQQTEIQRLKSEITAERAEMKDEVGHVIDTAQAQVTRMSHDVHELQEKANTTIRQYFDESVAASGGASYTRWGRTVCPGNSSTVYTGIMAGSHWSNTGGPTTTLCLPSDPVFGNQYGGQKGSYVYTVRFEMDPATTTAIFGSNVAGNDVPCVVCEATGRRSQLLVPARNVCYSGWHLEYAGYLMTSHHSHQRADAVCVDGNTEVVFGQSVVHSRANRANLHSGALFYLMEANGQIPGTPYTRSAELTCAICTK